MYFWACTVCSLLYCCASSSSVTKRQTKKWGGERIFWHVSDALERRMPSESSFVKFERTEAVKSATSIFLSAERENVFWGLKAKLESFDALTILLFVVKNITTMRETQSKPWISTFSVICLILSAQKQMRLHWKCWWVYWFLFPRMTTEHIFTDKEMYIHMNWLQEIQGKAVKFVIQM